VPDFWRHSGFHLLERTAGGRLAVTDDFLRAYLLRPELRPIEESLPGEIAFHERLLEAPRLAMSEADLATIEDADTRFNYGVWLRFRDRLIAAPDLESAYAGFFGGGGIDVPPLFLDQLAHIIVRSVLDGTEDALEARAAELFYREQKATVDDGRVLLADLETIDMHASGGVYGSLGRLIAEAQTPMKNVNLDVLDADNAATYWGRDQKHDLVVAFNYGRPALKAFARVMERWVRHFAGVEVTIEGLRDIRDEKWAWHIGLDAQATGVLNDLWRGEDVENGRLRRLIALFRMTFADPAAMRADIAGSPVYLALAMDEDNVVRMKPQNLLTNLPLAQAS
jgi:Family of unknown function (DUF6352)